MTIEFKMSFKGHLTDRPKRSVYQPLNSKDGIRINVACLITKRSVGSLIGLAAAICTWATPGVAKGSASEINLAKESWKEISFNGIASTAYVNHQGILKASVNASAGFLLKPFDRVRQVDAVTVDFRSTGKIKIKIKSGDQEKTKDGDDSILRIGLLLKGEAPLIPFFAPAWIKAIQASMKLPSRKLLYLVPTSLNPVGSQWSSPYNEDISSLVIASEKIADGWRRGRVTFSEPKLVVGIWLMADGDDTKSQFVTEVKSLTLASR